MLSNMDIDTGINLGKLFKVGALISQKLGRPNASKAGQALKP
jgi:hypothetical protein